MFDVPKLTGLGSTVYTIVLSGKTDTLMVEWTGPNRATMSYPFDLPSYNYVVKSKCFNKDKDGNDVFLSNCTDVLKLENDGSSLYIEDVKVPETTSGNKDSQGESSNK